MSDLWFNEWVDVYLAAIGHNDRSRAVLLAMKHHIVYELRATIAELGEVAGRQIAGGRVPEFANEVHNALVREIRTLRTDLAADARPDHSDEHYAAPQCVFCGNTGFVILPHWRCVIQPHDAPPRLCVFPGTKRLYTVAVLCDAPECARGRETRDKEMGFKTQRVTLLRYLSRFGTLDLVSMYREFEREQANACRRSLRIGGENGMAEVLEEIKKRKDAA